jgi:hypothetical protein
MSLKLPTALGITFDLTGRLTVKLRGRTEAPARGAEGAPFLSARGVKQEAHHGPLQRLLDGIDAAHSQVEIQHPVRGLDSENIHNLFKVRAEALPSLGVLVASKLQELYPLF